jgi:hypothetical protein
VITYADLHGNRESASSNPAVNPRVASKRRIVPSPSTRSRVDLAAISFKLYGWPPSWPWCGNAPGMAKKAITNAISPIGTLQCLLDIDRNQVGQGPGCINSLLNYKNPSPSRTSGYGASDYRTQEKRQRCHYGYVRYVLRIPLRRDELSHYDGTEREAPTSTKALECTENDASGTRISTRGSPMGLASSHTCVMVCEALQATEKMMNRPAESKKTSFRPKMSLNLANTTRTAGGRVRRE